MLELIKNALWSPLTVINILLIGIVILAKTRFNTLFKLPSILRDTIFSTRRNRRAFSLMCTSLGGTIGVGNAIGVAGAICEGGAGAVCWIAIAGIIGMAIKYAEVYFSMIYNGPIMYLEKSIGSKALSTIYAFLCVGVSLGMGNMAQTRSAIASVSGILPISGTMVAFFIAIAFLYVAKGGIEKIRKFSEIAVPLVSLMYVLLLGLILIHEREYLGTALKTVIKGSGVIVGIKWSLIKKGITIGFSKAIFSSEAGLGSSGFSHMESKIPPKEQAKWGVVEVLVDSLICIMTALSILVSENEVTGLPETHITRGVFTSSYGRFGELFFCLSMLVFAYASIICWYYTRTCAIK